MYPQVVDLNSDGIDDIVSGSYGGRISLFCGIKGGGVSPSSEIEQETDVTNRKNYYDYVFTNATFSDYNGDGLLDAFVGGVFGMRVMINEGTAAEPRFSERKPLLNVKGEIIQVFDEWSFDKRIEKEFHIFIHHLDWDGDGVEDLITAQSYMYEGTEPLLFYKGVSTPEGDRYEEAVPLINNWGTTDKLLPGKYLHPCILDYDGDGVLDILLGVTFEANKHTGEIYDDRLYEYFSSAAVLSRDKVLKEIKQKYTDPKDFMIALTTLNIHQANIQAKERFNPDNDESRGYVLLFKGKK